MSVRKERYENFVSNHLDLIAFKFDVEYYKHSHRYTIYNTKFGDLDYYPKANKVLIRKENKWIKPGLNWLYKNLEINN
jgi:hypothetical protein